MQINHGDITSQIFKGHPNFIIDEVDHFLKKTRSQFPAAKDFYLIHALILPKNMSEDAIHHFNDGLTLAYTKNTFHVLGGDTSAGDELAICLSTIVIRDY